MAQPPIERPPDPLEVRRDAVLKRVAQLRLHPKAQHNAGVQDKLTEIYDEIQKVPGTLELGVIEAGLGEIQRILDLDT